MKHIIILGDGMADHKVGTLGEKTLLQVAEKPYMDRLAREGRTGLLVTVPEGYNPGSEVANTAIMGYDLDKVYEGRGPLEAASIGYEMTNDDFAIRCNIITLGDGRFVTHNGGNLQTEDAAELIAMLNRELGSDTVRFIPGIQYRHLLVIKGGNKHIHCTPPHDVPLQPWRDHMLYAECPEAEETAQLLTDLILKSQELLSAHPLNIQRVKDGMDPANCIWPWGGGYRPRMTPLTTTYPQIKTGAVITAVDLIRGIGRYAGLRVIDVPGATGLFDTNFEGKAQAALEALKTDDFVYLHVEASDEAGHDGSVPLKLQTITDLDHRLVRPIIDSLTSESAAELYGDDVAVALLPDHPTPCKLRTHTNEPIPFCIWHPGIEADAVQTFGENAAKEGAYGTLEGDEFIQEFMK